VLVSEDSFFRHWANRALGNGQTGHWANRALGIGKIYKAIFAQIMNNFYALLLLSSPLFLRVLRAFAVL
jgi:hypothetical protein